MQKQKKKKELKHSSIKMQRFKSKVTHLGGLPRVLSLYPFLLQTFSLTKLQPLKDLFEVYTLVRGSARTTFGLISNGYVGNLTSRCGRNKHDSYSHSHTCTVIISRDLQCSSLFMQSQTWGIDPYIISLPSLRVTTI